MTKYDTTHPCEYGKQKNGRGGRTSRQQTERIVGQEKTKMKDKAAWKALK